MTRQRLTVQEAAEILRTSVDAVRMRVRRGSLDSDRGEDGRMYVWVNVDESETKREPNGKSTALISAKDETIRVLTEQLQAEREAHAEARRLLAALIQRVPELEAPASPEPPGGPEPTAEGPERAEQQPRSGTGGLHAGYERPRDTAEFPIRGGSLTRPWWRRVFGR